MMKKVIVTGGAGFIGSHTVIELMNEGYEPVIIDNFDNSDRRILKQMSEITGKEISFFEGDVKDESAVRTIFKEIGEVFGVIHFAAYKAVGESVDRPLKYYQNNVGGLINVLKVMQETGVKNMVFSSSCTVYGEPDRDMVTEMTERKPAASPYGNTKQIGEDILLDCHKSGLDVSSVILRYFNPIGAHPSGLIGELPMGVPNNLVPFITQTAAGKRDQLIVNGDNYDTPDGSCIRDYIHVVDLAKAHVKALDWLSSKTSTPVVDVFNLGIGEGNSVLELITKFENVTGEKVTMEIGPRRQGDIKSIWADVTKSKEELGWEAKLSPTQALEDAWRWEKFLSNNW